VEELADAMKERTLDGVQNALKRAKKVGVSDDHPQVKAGAELEARLIEEKETEEELNAAADARDMARIEKIMRKAEKMGMAELSNGYRKAAKMLERLKQEVEAMDNLRAALKTNKATVLLHAINRVNELGLDGKELELAKEALGKLGAQSEALLRLSEAVNRADIDSIDKEVATLEKMGLSDEDDVKNARDAKKKIVKQNAAADSLRAAIDSRVRDDIQKALSAGEALDIGKRFSEVIDRASKLIELIDQEDNLLKSLKKFVENDDEEGLDAQIEKARSLGAGDKVFAKAEEAKRQIAERKEIVRKLTEATENASTDKEMLQVLLDEAASMGIKGGKIEAAQNALNRDKVQKDARKALKKAAKGTDVTVLSEAIEKAIQLGMDCEELTKAKEVKVRLEEEKELSADVRAAIKSVTVKAESKSGVTEADLEPLDKAIEDAKNKGLSDESPFMKEAAAAKEKIQAVLQLQADIAKALDSGSLRQMKKQLDRAEDMELGSASIVKKLRSRIREEEKARAAAAMADEEVVEAAPSLDDEEMKRAREEKLRKAANPKYEWVRYAKIRNADDYSKGIFLNRKKIKASQLRWQNSVIPTSILDYTNKDLAKLATRIHKCTLGYTGDRSMSFPATLAQDILQKGLEVPDLVDEIYVQLLKHITSNPRPESSVRAWQLMCMCVGTFPPSKDFENYLINFILQAKDGAGAVGNYARYSLRRLEGILNSGPSGFVPSVEEIQAYKERPPILATIELVDGMLLRAYVGAQQRVQVSPKCLQARH
jgi:hypothetical protein